MWVGILYNKIGGIDPSTDFFDVPIWIIPKDTV